MYSIYSKWINILSILLALLAMGQLTFSLTMLFLCSTILSKAGAYVSTIFGVIASLVCLPISFKIKTYTSQLRMHHFDIQSYHRYVLYISLGVQGILVLVCCISLAQSDAIELALKKALMKYNRLASDKKFINIVQVLFQCCGVFSYQDWAYKDWMNLNKPLIECSDNYETGLDLNDICPCAKFSISANNENTKYLSAVPFSCCIINTAGSCRNFDLKCSGLTTINLCGCYPQLFTFIFSLIFSELLITFFICIVIIFLIKILHKEELAHLNGDVEKDNYVCDGKWDKFTNCTESVKQKEWSNPSKEFLISAKKERSNTSKEFSCTDLNHSVKQKEGTSTCKEISGAELVPSAKQKECGCTLKELSSVELIPSVKQNGRATTLKDISCAKLVPSEKHKECQCTLKEISSTKSIPSVKQKQSASTSKDVLSAKLVPSTKQKECQCTLKEISSTKSIPSVKQKQSASNSKEISRAKLAPLPEQKEYSCTSKNISTAELVPSVKQEQRTSTSKHISKAKLPPLAEHKEYSSTSKNISTAELVPSVKQKVCACTLTEIFSAELLYPSSEHKVGFKSSEEFSSAELIPSAQHQLVLTKKNTAELLSTSAGIRSSKKCKHSFDKPSKRTRSKTEYSKKH